MKVKETLIITHSRESLLVPCFSKTQVLWHSHACKALFCKRPYRPS